MLADGIDSILWITDTFFVSRLGDTALEAVGLGGYLSWLVFSIGSLLYMGTMVVVSQAWGAGDRDKAQRALAEAVSLSLLVSMPVVTAFWLSSPKLVSIIAGPEVSLEAKNMARSYFLARLASTPASYAALTIDSTFRATGTTKPIVKTSLAYALTNALLDPILIYGLMGAPRLGVLGAGAASSIANVVFLAANIALLSETGLRLSLARPSRIAFSIVSVGTPVLAERLTIVGGHLAYLSEIARCGDKALAAHTVGVRIESLAFLPLFSLSEATAVLSGQALGGKGPEEARKVTLEGALLSVVMGTLTGIVLALASRSLPRVFTSDPIVIRLAMAYLLLAAITEPLFGLAMALSMGLRGAGNTRIPLLVNLAVFYTSRVLLPPTLMGHAPRPVCAVIVWMSMVIDFSVRSIIFSIIVDRFLTRLARRVI